MKEMTLFFLLSFAFCTAGFAESPTSEVQTKRTEAQLAGFGMVPSKQDCTNTFGECRKSCAKSSVTGCNTECASDCEVCALDFGEDVTTVCATK